MVTCLTGARFTMQAEILRVEYLEQDEDSAVEGNWSTHQDPITGAILNDWIPVTNTQNNPTTSIKTPLGTFSCLARGIVDGGIRVAGTTERFGDTYENIDYVKMWVPSGVKISKRDRVTNIRAKRGGPVIWVDEETDGAATIFNVNGVTPLFDAFNRHTENFVLLEKADGD